MVGMPKVDLSLTFHLIGRFALFCLVSVKSVLTPLLSSCVYSYSIVVCFPFL